MKILLKELLEYADKEGFAVPAFNYSDIWELKAIVEAAEEEEAPVITQTNMQSAENMGVINCAVLGKAVAMQANVPVFNHLDHCTDSGMCKQAIDAGYPSVMIDCSSRELDENIRVTKQIVDYAHACGAVVEGEVGRIRGSNAEGVYEGNDFLVRVEDAIKMSSLTGIDMMAVGIGNAHGFYMETPKLDFERLREVNEAVSTPLVLHGGTGIPDEDIQRAISLGINKVNVGTHLHGTYIEELKEEVKRYKSSNVINLMTPVKDGVKEIVRRWIRICMADGVAGRMRRRRGNK